VTGPVSAPGPRRMFPDGSVSAPGPRRRLADRLIDAGTDVARRFVEADRYDPGRPSLGVLIAETLAEHERIGEERILSRVRALVEQRTKLRDERLTVARRHLDAGNLPPAASELTWGAALDEQIGALRLLLVTEEPT
jgi:hypothetical protein